MNSSLHCIVTTPASQIPGNALEQYYLRASDIAFKSNYVIQQQYRDRKIVEHRLRNALKIRKSSQSWKLSSKSCVQRTSVHDVIKYSFEAQEVVVDRI